MTTSIGKGVFGRVTYDQRRDVVVKQSTVTALGHGYPADMLGEISALISLQSLPSVVRIIDMSLNAARQCAVVLEPCLFDLRTWVDKTDTQQRLDRLDDLATSIGGALSVMHRVGMVHGDIKMSNILVNRNSDFCLADFGKTRMIRDAPKHVSNAPRYRPIDSDNPAYADSWAFMIVLIHAATGSAFFKGEPKAFFKTFDPRRFLQQQLGQSVHRVPSMFWRLVESIIHEDISMDQLIAPTHHLVQKTKETLLHEMPTDPRMKHVKSIRARCDTISCRSFDRLLGTFLNYTKSLSMVDLMAYAEVALVIATRWQVDVRIHHSSPDEWRQKVDQCRLRNVPDHDTLLTLQHRFLRTIGYQILSVD